MAAATVATAQVEDAALVMAAATVATAQVEEAALVMAAATALAAATVTASTPVAAATAAMVQAVTAMAVDMDTRLTPVAEAMAVAATVADMDTAATVTTDVVTTDREASTATRTGAVRSSDLDLAMCLRHLRATTLMGIRCPVTCRLTDPTRTRPIEQGR
jgi:hypothetical protein